VQNSAKKNRKNKKTKHKKKQKKNTCVIIEKANNRYNIYKEDLFYSLVHYLKSITYHKKCTIYKIPAFINIFILWLNVASDMSRLIFNLIISFQMVGPLNLILFFAKVVETFGIYNPTDCLVL
jgi:hypothetical protein